MISTCAPTMHLPHDFELFRYRWQLADPLVTVWHEGPLDVVSSTSTLVNMLAPCALGAR